MGAAHYRLLRTYGRHRNVDVNGLCIEVCPSGAKVWRNRYSGKAGMIKLAEYPIMSLGEPHRPSEINPSSAPSPLSIWRSEPRTLTPWSVERESC